MCQHAEPTEAHSQGAKDHRAAPNLHGDPANCQPADVIPRPPADRRPDAHREYSSCGTRAGQGARDRLAHVAGERRRPAWYPHLRPAPTTVAIFTATWEQGCILAMAKVLSGSAANAMHRQMSSRLLSLRHGKCLAVIKCV